MIIIGLAILILLPRFALLQNGLDHQRMADVIGINTAFRFLSAVKEHQLKEFYSAYHLYPLLGSYSFIPTIGAYYLTERLRGEFTSTEDFINAHALREDQLFLAIRLQMLILNLLGLVLLYFLVKRFTGNSTKAGVYALLFASLSFHTTLFSVVPRIHSFAFFTTILVLWFSFRLMENKSFKNYLLAFGSVAIAFSVSQSGATTFIIPLMAHFFENKDKKWKFNNYKYYLDKKLIYGILLFILPAVILGYPKILASVFQLSIPIKDCLALFTAPQAAKTFGFGNFFGYLKHYFLNIDLLSTWLICTAAFCLILKKKIQPTLKLEPYGIIAATHVLVFLFIFGFTNIMSDRFTLIIFPSLFFLTSRLAVQLDRKHWVFYPLVFLIVIYLYGWGNLTVIALAGDTREMASRYLLQNTDRNDYILSTMDRNLLGITPTPKSVKAGTSGPTGISDELIASKNLIGKKSRNYVWWNIVSGQYAQPDLQSFKYVVMSNVEAQGDKLKLIENYLSQNNFVLAKSFFAKRDEKDVYVADRLPWDMITPPIFYLLPVKLGEFKALGSNIFIFQKLH